MTQLITLGVHLLKVPQPSPHESMCDAEKLDCILKMPNISQYLQTERSYGVVQLPLPRWHLP